MNTHTNDLPKTSAPAQRALESVGVTNLMELARLTEKEVASLHGMGSKALNILRQALADKELTFAKES
jgi:hypothetical protein